MLHLNGNLSAMNKEQNLNNRLSGRENMQLVTYTDIVRQSSCQIGGVLKPYHWTLLERQQQCRQTLHSAQQARVDPQTILHNRRNRKFVAFDGRQNKQNFNLQSNLLQGKVKIITSKHPTVFRDIRCGLTAM